MGGNRGRRALRASMRDFLDIHTLYHVQIALPIYYLMSHIRLGRLFSLALYGTS
jgi:hypothetical protein